MLRILAQHRNAVSRDRRRFIIEDRPSHDNITGWPFLNIREIYHELRKRNTRATANDVEKTLMRLCDKDAIYHDAYLKYYIAPRHEEIDQIIASAGSADLILIERHDSDNPNKNAATKYICTT